MLQLGMKMQKSQLSRTDDDTNSAAMLVSENNESTPTKTSILIDSLVDRLIDLESLSSSTNSSPFSSSSSSSLSSSSSSSSSPFFTPHRYRYHFVTALNLEERKQLAELATSMNSTFTDERLLPQHSILSDLADAFNWPANYATKVVAFCRSLPSYACLPQADQLAVLKQFYMECLTLRTSFNYDPVANGYPVLAVSCFIDDGISS